ncbi:MAG: DUF1576 domain-containing protein [Clostridiales bacterium]|nr:DUF1576 domain-containing protein [Clostridiales bacterium]
MTRLTRPRRAAPDHTSDRSPAGFRGGRTQHSVMTIPGRYADAFAYGAMACVSLLLIAFGLTQTTLGELIAGLWRIVRSSGVLITDYVALGGVGPAFVNAGLLMLVSVWLLLLFHARFRGLSTIAIFLMGSFGLFGKNIFNVWPIIFGAWLYARLNREPFREHIHTALFATSLAPVVTECAFVLHLPGRVGIPLGMVVGLVVGLVIAPLAAHLKNVHKGFSLYNVGFTAGILGTVIVSLLKSYGYQTGFNLIWSTGNDALFLGFLALLFAFLMLLGIASSHGTIQSLRAIFAETGQSCEDFAAIGGVGAALVNMGLNGLIATAYVLLVRGPLNGPTIGGILTIAGFGAGGKHARNIIPILFGVVLGSLTKVWNINDPSVLLAALFGTCLAPIAGHYGWAWGVAAGFLNSSVALCSGVLHGGMNLYNTGFSAGIVAAFLVPLMEALKRRARPRESEPAR